MTLEPNDVNSSGAVSPTAMAMPSSDAVIIPDRAVGRTTDHTVRNSDDPRANDASRNPPGTIRNTSSVVRVTDGSMRMNRARAARIPAYRLKLVSTKTDR
jgi:hypothetical protein